ncbi:MAG TPA: hypothetical protein VN228_19535 [Pyrinomonadaceae bacterium]|nr:hypothetical protein [Pyrinomonadaceae bacterium]
MPGAKRSAAKKAAGVAAPKRTRRAAEKTDDGRHVIVDGRRWRASDPALPEEERQRLVNELMAARRAVGKALREGDAGAEAVARRRVHEAKVALGERGPKWWEEEESAEVKMRNAE